MPTRVFSVLGLGFGDEGKGATVDYLCNVYGGLEKGKRDVVVRHSGGPQCSHAVRIPPANGGDGRFHRFRMFGSGTFSDAATYIHKSTVVDLEQIIVEAETLAKFGVKSPLQLLFLHDGCLVSTAYHKILNTVRHYASGNTGTCGHGVGATVEYYLKYGQDAIFVHDVVNPARRRILTDKLQLLYDRVVHEAYESNLVDSSHCEEIVMDPRSAKTNRKLTASTVADLLRTAGAQIAENATIVTDWTDGSTGAFNTLLANAGLIVFEGAQGALLDRYYGTAPYNAWTDATLKPVADVLDFIANTRNPPDMLPAVNLGVLRSYHTRHGSGPFPTETAGGNDDNNPENQFQGKMRAGTFDLMLYQYALRIMHSVRTLPKFKLTGIVLNHVDLYNGEFCTGYAFKNQSIDIYSDFDNLLSNACGDTDNFLPNASVSKQLTTCLYDAGLEPVITAGNIEELIFKIDEFAVPVVLMAKGPDLRDRFEVANKLSTLTGIS